MFVFYNFLPAFLNYDFVIYLINLLYYDIHKYRYLSVTLEFIAEITSIHFSM